MGKMVAIGKKSPSPPRRMPKQGILVADHWGPSFSSLGVFCMYLRACLGFLSYLRGMTSWGVPLEISRVIANSTTILVFFFQWDLKASGGFPQN